MENVNYFNLSPYSNGETETEFKKRLDKYLGILEKTKSDRFEVKFEGMLSTLDREETHLLVEYVKNDFV